MDHRTQVRKNIAFAGAVLFLWISIRVFESRVLHDGIDGLKTYDIAFIFLPPLLAFFFNWKWMRQERTDVIIKWSTSWAGINLGLLIVAVVALRYPVCWLIQQIPS